MEKGLPAREAPLKAMEEITGPVVAITLVLSSVLLPSAFLTGLVGQFFRQFALTILVSMLISAVNAMTMTPALAVLFFSGRTLAGRASDGAVQPSLARPANGQQGKEALPWWSFALLGGALTYAFSQGLLTTILGRPVTLSPVLLVALSLFGAVAGGALGQLLIRPVNWALGF